MRTIKFRVWDNEEKKFFEPIYEAYKGNLIDMSISLSGELLRRTLQFPHSEHESCFKGRYELMQFAGLTDKNGVEIYENDVLDNDEVVIFSQGAFMTSIGALCLSANHREVVGNTYQNETKDQ